MAWLLDLKVCCVAGVHVPTTQSPRHSNLWFGSGCHLIPRAIEVCLGWTLRIIFVGCLFIFTVDLGFLPPWISQYFLNNIDWAEIDLNLMQKTALLQSTAIFMFKQCKIYTFYALPLTDTQTLSSKQTKNRLFQIRHSLSLL